MDYSKLMVFERNTLSVHVSQMTVSALDIVENIVEKWEMLVTLHFLLFQQCFQKPPFSGSLKLGIVWY